MNLIKTNEKEENRIHEFLLKKGYTKDNPLVFHWSEECRIESIYEPYGRWPDLPMVACRENRYGTSIVHMGGISKMYALKSKKTVKIAVKWRKQKCDRYGSTTFLDIFDEEAWMDLRSAKYFTEGIGFIEDLHKTVSYTLTLKQLKEYIKKFA